MRTLISFLCLRVMSFYAVRAGRKPGIYSTWSECEAQVKNFSKAKFKKFKTNQEAVDFLGNTIKIDSEEIIKIATNPSKRKIAVAEPSPKRKAKYKNETSEEEFVKELPVNVKQGDFNFYGKPATVYTDGACSGNGRESAKAGIGVYWGPSHPLNVSRKLAGRQSNNRAELTAALVAINQAAAHNASELTVFTDSQFMINSMTQWISKWKSNGWKLSSGGEVQNMSDFKKLDEACSRVKVIWKYVPGHKGIQGNEMADRLARDALK